MGYETFAVTRTCRTNIIK